MRIYFYLSAVYLSRPTVFHEKCYTNENVYIFYVLGSILMYIIYAYAYILEINTTQSKKKTDHF